MAIQLADDEDVDIDAEMLRDVNLYKESLVKKPTNEKRDDERPNNPSLNPYVDIRLAEDGHPENVISSDRVQTPVIPMSSIFPTPEATRSQFNTGGNSVAFITGKGKHMKKPATGERIGKPPRPDIKEEQKRPPTVPIAAENDEFDEDLLLPLDDKPHKESEEKEIEIELGAYRPTTGEKRRPRTGVKMENTVRVNQKKDYINGPIQQAAERSMAKTAPVKIVFDEEGLLDKELEQLQTNGNKLKEPVINDEEDKEFNEHFGESRSKNEAIIKSLKIPEENSIIPENVEDSEPLPSKPQASSRILMRVDATVNTDPDQEITKLKKEIERLSITNKDLFEQTKILQKSYHDKELGLVEEKNKIEEFYSTLTASLKKELEEAKTELQTINQKYEKEKQAEFSQVRLKYEVQVSALNEKLVNTKSELEKTHSVEIELLKNQHKHEMAVLKKQLEEENEKIRARLQKEFALNKLSTNLGNFSEELKGKITGELSQKQAELDQKIRNVDSMRMSLKIFEQKLATEKEEVERIKMKYTEMQEQLEKEIASQKEIYEYKKNLLEEQQTKFQVEEAQKRAKLLEDQHALEMKKAQHEQKVREWNSINGQQKMSLSLELKELEQRRREFEQTLQEHDEALTAKLSAIENTRRELCRDQTDLLRRCQLCTEKELLLKQEYDALQVKMEEFYHEKKLIENEKAKIEAVVRQVEQESLAIKHAKEELDQRIGQWNDIRAELDMKEENLREERRRAEQARHAVLQKHRSLETLRYEYLKGQVVEQTAKKLISKWPLNTPERKSLTTLYKPSAQFNSEKLLSPYKPITPFMSEKPLKEEFSASKFIQDLEQEVKCEKSQLQQYGKRTKFMQYVTSERNTMMKSKQDLRSTITQSLAHSRSRQMANTSSTTMFNPIREEKRMDRTSSPAAVLSMTIQQ
eukprot:TRINITY_DN4087_c0_g1_i1.p1 TRINITY_DN4087_c0_g1~~TRINITY_DN4087_c0_g1_i1.p1  ORF type:complete len:923 (+),score=164.87 TRINITY_DN4087_c0_g1_i1:4120-6888(+)